MISVGICGGLAPGLRRSAASVIAHAKSSAVASATAPIRLARGAGAAHPRGRARRHRGRRCCRHRSGREGRALSRHERRWPSTWKAHIAARVAAATACPSRLCASFPMRRTTGCRRPCIGAIDADGQLRLGAVLRLDRAQPAADPGTDPHGTRQRTGDEEPTPLLRPCGDWLWLPAPRLASARHGGRRRYSAGRWLRQIDIGRHRAFGLHAACAPAANGFHGCLTELATAVPSKPQCTMQLAHFS